MSGKVYALLESFEAAFSFVKDLEVIHKKFIYIDKFTDFKRIFDAVTKGRETTKNRSIIDILAICEAYHRSKILGIGLD